MDYTLNLIPAIFVVLANLLGGDHKSDSYENWTAVFGWTACVSFVLVLLCSWLWPNIAPYVWQIFGFSIITALSRDYEKILKPLFQGDRKNKK